MSNNQQITDDDIRALAERKGFRFELKKPWEFCPWEIDGPCPFQTTEHWERAARFRDELIAEIEASRREAKPKPRAKRRR